MAEKLKRRDDIRAQQQKEKNEMEQVYQRERLMAGISEKIETPDDSESNYPDLWDDSEEEEMKSQKADVVAGLE